MSAFIFQLIKELIKLSGKNGVDEFYRDRFRSPPGSSLVAPGITMDMAVLDAVQKRSAVDWEATRPLLAEQYMQAGIPIFASIALRGYSV